MIFHYSRRSFVVMSGAAALGSVACRSSAPRLRIFAAASLTEVMAQVVEDFAAAQPGPAPELVLAGTSRLAAQIRAGAPADVFLSADEPWMDTLVAEGLVVASSRQDLLTNRLVVAVPADDGMALHRFDDLRGCATLALAQAEVPAGRYARAALTSLGLWDELARRVVEADNVRTALAWVSRGEVDAAVVYVTDALAEPAVRVALELPADSHPSVIYPIARCAASRESARAQAFVDFCCGPVAADRFRAAGFGLV